MKNYTIYDKNGITTFYMKRINNLTGHFIVVDTKNGKVICKFYGKI